MNLPNYNNNPASDIIKNFDRTLFEAFNSAVDRNNVPAWKEILSFIVKQTSIAIQEKSDFVLGSLINLPTALYISNSQKEDVINYLVNTLSVFYKTMSYNFKSEIGKSDIIDKNPSILYKFYGGVLSLYHYLIFHSDQRVLSNALNEFNQMKAENYDVDTRQTIENLTRGGTEEDKRAIRDSATMKHLYDITDRRARLGYFSWIIYLYALDKIDKPKFQFLIGKIDLHYLFFEDLLEDVVQIRKTAFAGFLGFSSWDHTERESGILYSPPSVSDWILYGVCFWLLKGEIPNFSMDAIIDERDYAFLHDSVKILLEYFSKYIEKWQRPLGLVSEADKDADQQRVLIKSDLEVRARRILNIFERLKILHDKHENSLIAAQELDDMRVNEFKARLFQAWKRECTTFDLFSHFGNQHVLDNPDGLPYQGSKFLLQRFKMMFTEINYQQIYGSADLGADVGRRTDGSFLSEIFKENTDIHVFPSISTGLDACIAALKKEKDINPDLIVIPPEFIYKTNILELPGFIAENTPNAIGSMGKYRNIPVITFYSTVLNTQIIVTSFKHAFSLDVYENEKFIERRLHIQIKQLTSKEIDEEFEKNRDSWKVDEKGFSLTDEQGKIRLSTSINLEIWSRAKFNIVDSNAIQIFRISEM